MIDQQVGVVRGLVQVIAHRMRRRVSGPSIRDTQMEGVVGGAFDGQAMCEDRGTLGHLTARGQYGG